MLRSSVGTVLAVAALMLITIPARAQQSSSTSSANSETSSMSSSSTSSASSTTSSSSSSSKEMNQGRRVKEKCTGLRGKARVTCVHAVNSPRGLSKTVLKDLRSDEEKQPSTVRFMKHIIKMGKRHIRSDN